MMCVATWKLLLATDTVGRIMALIDGVPLSTRHERDLCGRPRLRALSISTCAGPDHFRSKT